MLSRRRRVGASVAPLHSSGLESNGGRSRVEKLKEPDLTWLTVERISAQHCFLGIRDSLSGAGRLLEALADRDAHNKRGANPNFRFELDRSAMLLND